MQVVLREDFPQLGYIGDKVKVKPGFARNFLIPRGLAIEASSGNMKQLQHYLAGIARKRMKLKQDADEVAQRLAAQSLEFTLKLGKGGKTFGSITSRDIEQKLSAAGFQVDHRRIKIHEPLKKIGQYSVDVKLHAEVSVSVAVKVLEEILPEAKESVNEDGEGRKKSGKKRRSSKSAQRSEANLAEKTAEDTKVSDA